MSRLIKAFIVPMFMLVMTSSAWAQSGTSNAVPAVGAAGAHTAQDVRFVMSASAAGQTEILAAAWRRRKRNRPRSRRLPTP